MHATSDHISTYTNFMIFVQAAGLHIIATLVGLAVAVIGGHTVLGIGFIVLSTIVIAAWAKGRSRPDRA